jgi:hypothetical protein
VINQGWQLGLPLEYLGNSRVLEKFKKLKREEIRGGRVGAHYRRQIS